MPDPFAQYAVQTVDPFAAFAVADDGPAAPDPRVVAEQKRLTEPGFARQVLISGADNARGISERALIGMTAGAAGKMLAKAPGIIQKAAGVLSSPWVSGGIGAIEGGRRGGVTGAIAGGAAGVGGAKIAGQIGAKLAAPDVAGGMSAAGRAAEAGPTLARARELERLLKSGSLDDLQAFLGPRAVAPVATAAAPAASALESELMAREMLARPINWRTTDVTPIKRPGANIHFGEESTPGLLKLLQDALMAKNKPLAEKLQTAIRQRSHITGKVGEP